MGHSQRQCRHRSAPGGLGRRYDAGGWWRFVWRCQGRWSSAELGGQFKLEIYRRGIDLILVPPTTLKLAFAGKGNADKPKMKAAGVSLFDLDEDLNDDEVDAYALRSLGEAMLYGEGPSEFVKRAKAAIGKVELHHGKGRPKVQTIAQLSVG